MSIVCPSKIDISNYIARSDDTRVDPRLYVLDRFNLDGTIASDDDLAQLQEKNLEVFWKKTRHQLHLPIHYYQKPYIYEPQENQYRLDVDFLRLRVRRTVCLIGFWESEGYFKDIEDCIRREYMLKVPPDDRNAELLAQISQKQRRQPAYPPRVIKRLNLHGGRCRWIIMCRLRTTSLRDHRPRTFMCSLMMRNGRQKIFICLILLQLWRTILLPQKICV